MTKYTSGRQKNLKVGIVSYSENLTSLEVVGGAIFSGESTGELVRISQIGTGPAFIVEDSANPDVTPFVVTTEGKVAIGVAAGGISTSYKLEVDGGDIRFVKGGQGDLIISHSNLVSNVRASGNVQLGLGANGEDAIRINLNNNVGIGTTNPTSKLYVVGDGYFTGVVTALSFSGNASSATYATSAGIATYATTAGIATYATYAINAGVSTSVIGGIGSIAQLNVSGLSTFNAISVGGTTGVNGQYLKSTGDGLVWASFTPLRSVYNFIAENSQKQFDVAGISSGYVDVFLNGIRLDDINYSLVGTGVSLTVGTFTNDEVTIISYNTTGAGSGGGTGSGSEWTRVGNGIYNTGRVSIGTDTVGSGSTVLYVVGDARITGILSIGQGTVTIDGSTNTLTVPNLVVTNNTSGINLASYATTAGISTNSIYSFSSGIASYADNSGISTYSITAGISTNVIGGIGSITQLNVSNNSYLIGNVGVGTTNPLQNLDIRGNLRITGAIYDGFDNVGLSGQILSSTGTKVQWINVSSANVGSANSIGINLDSSNSSRYITFVDNTSGTNIVKVDSDLIYNPNTNTLTASNFVGSLSGTATTATNLYDAANITTGTINSARLSGTYNININGNASSATYATSAGIATYATSTGIATYATSAGISTYATSAGIATYSNNAGIATSVIGGIASVTQLNVSGVSTLGFITTRNLYSSGIVTASAFYGDGTNLRGVPRSYYTEYSSSANVSNSALSISGISSYSQLAVIKGTYASQFNDYYGGSVALTPDGNTLVIGAWDDEISGSAGYGVVYVYDRNYGGGSDVYGEVGILTGFYASQSGDFFGISVSVSADGNTVVVGASGDETTGTDTGVVYVYDRTTENTFTQVGILTGSDSTTGDQFGEGLAISPNGSSIIVAAVGNGSRFYHFVRSGNTFDQVDLYAYGSFAGYSLNFNGDGKSFVATDNNTVILFELIDGFINIVDSYVDGSTLYSAAISADGKTIIAGNNNGVSVFDRVGNSLSRVGILTAVVDPTSSYGESAAISADGKTIIVGAYQDNGTKGRVFIYNRQGNVFNQVGIVTAGSRANAGDWFGYSLALSADAKTLIVGAPVDELTGSTGYGSVYIFNQTQQTYLYSGPTGNIGIGSTSPTTKLDVVGDARIGINTSQGVILTSANGTKYRLIVSDAGTLSTVLVT